MSTKKLLTITAGALFILSFASVPAHAADAPATTPAPVDTCTPTATDFANLEAIENNPQLSATDELTQELAFRKQLLAKTITCAIGDAQSLKATVDATSPDTTTGHSLQSQLSGKFSDAINFYNIESGKLDGAGISATQTIAKEILAWRSANYAPLEGDTTNFLIWSENQALFNTAQTRLNQTKQVVSFIESAASTNGDIAGGLSAADASFNNAESENAAAAQDISELQPADQTLLTIQQSLQSLADTYQKFSDLNDLIQKLLPTQQ